MADTKYPYPDEYPTPPDPLTAEKLKRIRDFELKDWKVIESPLPENTTATRMELYKVFHFESFPKAIEFMTRISEACEIIPHHPRWENTWRTLKIYLTTWDAQHRISYKDIQLARHIEKVYQSGYAAGEDPSANGLNWQAIEKKEWVKSIREYIEKDELERAFQNLKDTQLLNMENEEYNAFLALSQRFNKIQKERRWDLIPYNEYNIQMNGIVNSLLAILSDIERGLESSQVAD